MKKTKTYIKFITILLTFVILFTIPLNTSSVLDGNNTNIKDTLSSQNTSDKNPNMEYCHHGIACDFDDQTMTLTNAYEGNRVKNMM